MSIGKKNRLEIAEAIQQLSELDERSQRLTFERLKKKFDKNSNEENIATKHIVDFHKWSYLSKIFG